MKIKTARLLGLIISVLIIPLLSGCVILFVDQPSTVNSGETITVYIEYHTIYEDPNPHHGILGLLIPVDWVVDSVYYEGDFGFGTASFLHPDSADADPGGNYEYWADSLELHFPSPANMHWVVYQSDEGHTVDVDTSYVDLYIEMNVGQTGGNYDLGYFVSSGASEIQDPGTFIWYGLSLDNAIVVTGGSKVPNENSTPRKYKLSQNYPNPFNPATTIAFDLPVSGHVILNVYNLLGEEVATVADDYFTTGSHCLLFDASALQSGVYYYKIQTENFVATKKMLLIK